MSAFGCPGSVRYGKTDREKTEEAFRGYETMIGLAPMILILQTRICLAYIVLLGPDLFSFTEDPENVEQISAYLRGNKATVSFASLY